MNPTHLRLASTATRLIKNNGRSMILVRYTETGGHMNLVRVPEFQPIVAVQTKFSRFESEDVQKDDKMLLIDAQTEINGHMRIRDYGPIVNVQIPLGEWRVGIDGFGSTVGATSYTEYSIVHVDLVEPGDVKMLYKLHVRGGIPVPIETVELGGIGWNDTEQVGWNDTEVLGWAA